MSEKAIKLPERNPDLDAFRMWAANHFRDTLVDPLRHRDLNHYYHESVEAAWLAWKASAGYVTVENQRLRKLLAEVSRHTLGGLVVTEPDKIA